MTTKSTKTRSTICPHGIDRMDYASELETGMTESGRTHCCDADTTFLGDSLIQSCRCCWTDVTWIGAPLKVIP